MASSAVSMGSIKTPASVGEGLKAIAAREYPTEVKQIGAAITGKTIGGVAKEMVKAEVEEAYPEEAAAYRRMRGM